LSSCYHVLICKYYRQSFGFERIKREAVLKVLVVGNGAREHALIWKLAQSPRIRSLFAAPGNAGTAQIATNLDIKPNDFAALGTAVKQNQIELVVVGPEGPLVEGIADYFQKLGIPIFGPSRAAAQLEGSKAFSKNLFQKNGIPCARSKTFSDLESARKYIQEMGAPLVIKADGLAAGKGVIMAETVQQALDGVSAIMESRAFGSAGDRVVIEEWLVGREMSFFAITDGQSVLPLVPACDYKRVSDGDLGLNTGGMGSYSPTTFYTHELGQKIISTIIEPTIRAMAEGGTPFQGILYAGLMVKDNQPKLLEYNVRFGDPECQVILPRLKSDFMDIVMGVVNKNLQSVKPDWNSDPCVGVVLASGGYPGNYRTGLPIHGLDAMSEDIIVFHAGTKIGESGQVLTNGGRVLTVVSTGSTIEEARQRIYSDIDKIQFEGAQYRRDIARF
jgi:phosphoribosylamine--glycine ligase